MKKYLRLLALLAILGLFVMGQSGCTGSDASGSGTGTIMGTVKDSVTNQPIEGATVSINSLSAQTNSQGQYQINNTPSGKVTVSKTGDHSQSEKIIIDAGQTVTADFQLTPFITETLINETATVAAGQHRDYPVYLKAGGNLDISLTATQDIHFYLFDETNYWNWRNNQSNTAYIIADNVSSFSQTFNIPTSQKYYFVIWNTHTLLSSSVKLEVLYTH